MKDISKSQLRSHMNEQIKAWLGYMGGRQWELALKDSIKLSGPFQAHDLDSDRVSEEAPDQWEYRLTALFKFTGSLGAPQMVEYPQEGLKQGPEDELDVGHSERDLSRAIKILL